MYFFRAYLRNLNVATIASFLFSWAGFFFFLPLSVSVLASTHDVSSTYNLDKGCFDIVLEHSEESNSGYNTVEKKHHQFQNQCCYDDARIRNECPDCEIALPTFSYLPGSYVEPVFQFTASIYPKNSLSPPVTFKVIKVTQLLI
ncbi:MAG: hypothetical protein MK198_11920 [Gracilimonas sp.]|uniref:hypothetical protein n=1 Tax=Gracilimonas sp. TaxID=1974203 RepID=UPI0037527576|nr:hypothetical protein [Gracilimonas sp.]